MSDMALLQYTVRHQVHPVYEVDLREPIKGHEDEGLSESGITIEMVRRSFQSILADLDDKQFQNIWRVMCDQAVLKAEKDVPGPEAEEKREELTLRELQSIVESWPPFELRAYAYEVNKHVELFGSIEDLLRQYHAMAAKVYSALLSTQYGEKSRVDNLLFHRPDHHSYPQSLN